MSEGEDAKKQALRDHLKSNTVKADDIFRGRTLSSWMAEWVQFMHGQSVSYTGLNGEILFTRGGLSYGYETTGGPRIQIGPDYKEEVYVTPDVPIYINVRTAFYFTGEPHPFGTLNTLSNVIGACRDDHARGKAKKSEITRLANPKATIKDQGSVTVPLDSDYVESFGINVIVDPNSALADQFEFAVQRGTQLTGCAVGEILILRSLPEGDYIIVTKNIGARGYQSSSEFTIHVGSSRFLSHY